MTESARSAAQIFERVLGPSLRGGSLEIGNPFGGKRARAAAEIFAREAGGGTTAIDDDLLDHAMERVRRLTPLDPSSLSVRITPAVVELAALAHDLVAGFHPGLASSIWRSTSRTLLESTCASLSQVVAPDSPLEALLRHVWLSGLLRFELVRTDVKWWIGGATYVGEAPPPRLLAWPGLRRVRSDESKSDLLRLPELFEARADDALEALFARGLALFLAATPLTDLVHAARSTPPFVWSPQAEALVSSPVGARLARRAMGLQDDQGRQALDAIASLANRATGESSLALRAFAR